MNNLLNVLMRGRMLGISNQTVNNLRKGPYIVCYLHIFRPNNGEVFRLLIEIFTGKARTRDKMLHTKELKYGHVKKKK